MISSKHCHRIIILMKFQYPSKLSRRYVNDFMLQMIKDVNLENKFENNSVS